LVRVGFLRGIRVIDLRRWRWAIGNNRVNKRAKRRVSCKHKIGLKVIILWVSLWVVKRIELAIIIHKRFSWVIKHKKLIRLVVKHIKLIKLAIKHIQLIRLVVKHIQLIRLVVKHTELIRLVIGQLLIKVSEQFIFQRLNIRFFLKLFLMGYILHICLRKLKEYIQFNILQHNNLLLFFLLEPFQLF
jgi:hypothetical protein